MPLRIEDYALIGDCETVALVGRDGSIDWLCWPRFDSGACFAALLGGPEHGRWLVAPAVPVLAVQRRYRPDTLILETEFTTETGKVLLIDFMPPRSGVSDLVRLVVGCEGQVPMRMELVVRFDYGSVVPWVTRLKDGALRCVAGPDMVVLHTNTPHHGEGLMTRGEFVVGAGETVSATLTYAPSHHPAPGGIDPASSLVDTETYWREWTSRCVSTGPWSEAVRRSLITLKALTYSPTGGIAAAATTSLPEKLGGSRNWDYRYCWLRDATLTLLALIDSGFHDEARAWGDWLLRAAAGSPGQLQIMYGLAGERRLTEWEVPWLPGYEGSKPVRIGNAAHDQLQLDVFGELMDALYHALHAGLRGDGAGWAFARGLLRHLETVWRQPDEGIWEVRGGREHFTYSKVMAWVAFDRGARIAREFGFEGPVERWEACGREIHTQVCEQGYDPALGSFVRAYGSRHLDASLLLLPIVGFLPPDDPRIVGTVRAIEERLVRGGFVLRYDTEEARDGLPAGEGAFLACSFWLADVYVLMGRLDEARALFERLLSLRNDVGLLAEEYDVASGRHVGNFPQAFSHVALVDTALNLTRAGKPAEQRSRRSDRATA